MATNVGRITVGLEANLKNFNSNIQKAQTTIKGFTKQVEKRSASARDQWVKFGKAAEQSKFIFAGVTAALAGIGIASVASAGKMEQWEVAFTTMLGSAEKAQTVLGRLSDFAAKTPFDLPEVVTAGRQLLAFGITADDLIPTIKMLGDTAAGLGVPMERLILNFGQVAAQGKLTGRELRDFAIAGVPLLDELARTLNKSKVEIQDMVSRGQIGFPIVVQAFQRMTSEGGRFNNLMIEQSKTLFGLISNLKDNFIRLGIVFGQTFLPLAKTLVSISLRLTDIFQKLNPEFIKLGAVILTAGAAFTGLVTVVAGLAFIGPPVIAVLGTMSGAIWAVLAAVTAVVAGFAAFGVNLGGIQDKIKTVYNRAKELFGVFSLGEKDLKSIGLTITRVLIQGFSKALISIVNLISKSKILSGIFKVLGVDLQGLSGKLTDQISKYNENAQAALLNAQLKQQAENERAQAEKTINDKETQDEINRKFKLATSSIEAEALKQKGLQTIAEEADKFTAEAQANAEKRNQEMEAKRREAYQKHRSTLQSIASESEQFMTNIFSRNLTEREKKQAAFRQAMGILQNQITQAYIAAAATRRAQAIKTSAVETAAAKPAIAANFFKAHSFLPFVGQAIALGFITAAFAFIDRLVKFNQGGLVPGTGNQDTVPALLTPGERVLTKAQNRAYERGAGGAGVNLVFNINGQFLEANESRWQQLVRNNIIPEIRRSTMINPTSLFNRKRGQV